MESTGRTKELINIIFPSYINWIGIISICKDFFRNIFVLVWNRMMIFETKLFAGEWNSRGYTNSIVGKLMQGI